MTNDVPKGHKKCGRCGEVKPKFLFRAYRGKVGPTCQLCSTRAQAAARNERRRRERAQLHGIR